ncbi:ATPase, T2SS/T4P/T4SS family [Halorussus salinus]|uniref:ATPase, T2SS/T4P/T4SS family n=1 Tax=Halorussus salinus TaxID=1364935 RepID=UPI0010926920|nr:ATPase, T2SS/T4P/T4SS family [Halorussus salinus]
MRNPLPRFRDEDPDCACVPRFEETRLLLDASDCPGGGDLAAEPACRRTAIDAVADREAESVVTRTDRLERAYEAESAGLLVAAGRFAERVAFYDETLAERTETDPLAAARAALGRAGPVSDIAAETGLAECARRAEESAHHADENAHHGDEYAHALRPFVGPPIAKARVAADPPPDATLAETRDLATGATVRIYADERALRTYHLEPVEHGFDAGALDALAEAYGLLAEGAVAQSGLGATASERAPARAVRRVADADQPVEAIAAALAKHTRGYGVLADFFADPAVSDVFATAPVGRNPLRVTVGGERMRTNVRLTEEGARTLASRFRRESGRAFSRAAPTLDATADLDGSAAVGGDATAPDRGTVRVAGVTDPVSDGPGFAFRAHDATPWTLPALVANDTLPADAAALLSLSAERAAAGLVAGPRGAGKTTLLGALCWELPASTRTVVIEDTPELPVAALQRGGRDIQPLRTDTDDGPGLAPPEALRTALRLGEGALVVGEVRGEEAAVLYEAMRVGANGDAVLGTIHGDGGAGVRERVVSDLDVPASSFATTDLVVTLEAVSTPGGKRRRVKAIEEVGGDDGDRFDALYAIDSDRLAPTGRIDRGNSALVAALAAPDESYADARDALADRESLLADLARRDRTAPAEVVSAYADRRAS